VTDRVLAVAGGYEAAALRPFVRSLRASGFAGEIRLLLHRNPPGTAEALLAMGATPLPVELPGVPETWSYNVERYRHFAPLLEDLGPGDRALLADARDVVFQSEPFDAFPGEEVHLFEEHPSKPVGRCIWTQAWVRYRYGDEALPPIAARPVLCSGFAIGAANRVRDLARIVAGEILPSLKATHYMAGYDQGVVNHLAYAGAIPALRIHPWPTTRVVHLGNVPAGEVRLDARGRVLDPSGRVALAVHQYDRHPALSALGEPTG